MSMTKKDYELIASTIAKLHQEQFDRYKAIPSEHPQAENAHGQLRALEQLSADLSAEFRKANPDFSALKFMSKAVHNTH